MGIPELIKAGDDRVLLGLNKTPSLVDCRVISEDNYQFILKLIYDIRQNDIKNKIENNKMLPQDIRKRMQKFLEANNL